VCERDGPTGAITRVYRHVNKAIVALAPREIQDVFAAHAARTVRESLCVLYVAMTRARHALHMLIEPPHENEKTIPQRFSSVLRCALAAGPCEPGDVVYQHGEAHWYAGHKPAPAPPPPAHESSARIALRPQARSESHFSAASPSALSRGGQVADQLALMDEAALDRGRAAHAALSLVGWLDDGAPGRDAMLLAAKAAAPRRSESWAANVVDQLLAAMDQPGVKAALSRQPGGRPYRIEREVPYARIVEGGIESGTIDRLIVALDGQTPVAATIIDFKTDAIPAEFAAMRALGYQRQMDAYRAAAAEMFALPQESVKTAVVFIEPGVVVEL
jgi:ATP-dependent exoDNAse (exonuclease V) beta subunit